jgi:hypothetical protein
MEPVGQTYSGMSAAGNLKGHFLCDLQPAILPVGLQVKGDKDACRETSISAAFTKAKTWTLSTGSVIREMLSKVWSNYKREYLAAN